MADKEKKKNEEEPKKQEDDKKSESTEKKALLAGLLPWIIMAVVVIVCAGIGIGLARLFGESGTTEPAQQQQEQGDPFKELKADSSKARAGSIWYYPLEPVVANLDEPGATRYIRATLTLGVGAEMDKKKGTEFLNEKIPILINWLTIYLSNLTINDATGAANLRRIQSQILDAFNEELFPNSRPRIEKIFLTEFAIQ